MIRIERLSYCAVAVPLDEPIGFATGDVATRCFGLLKVHDSDGGVGLGYCFLGNRPVSLVATAIAELLAPVVLGQETSAVEILWARMAMATQLHGRAGAVHRAMGLIDIALWDLKARRNGLPLYRQLGGGDRAAVDAYAAGGYYGANKGIPELVAELQELRELGFRAIKIKTGKLTPEAEQRRVEAARREIGPDADLLLDANNAWPDVEAAMRYLRPLEGLNPFWIEEPFVEDDIDALRQLAATSGIRVATGENEANPLRFKEILRAGAAAIIQPDATVCGGITPWMRIAAMAANRNVLVCPHAYHDLHVHLLGAIGSEGWLEFMPGERVMNFGRLITGELAFSDGRVSLPAAAGLGFEFDEAAVARHAAGRCPNGGPWHVSA